MYRVTWTLKDGLTTEVIYDKLEYVIQEVNDFEDGVTQIKLVVERIPDDQKSDLTS